METSVVLGKVFKTNNWIKAPASDIEWIDEDKNRLWPFDMNSHNKKRKYVVKDAKDASKLLIIHIAEFAESEAALDRKILDEDGNMKRYTIPRRLSVGPVEFERSDFLEEEDEVNGAKLRRAALESVRRNTVSEEYRLINTASSNKKKVQKPKKQSELNTKEARKAAFADDIQILKASNKASPRKRKLAVVGPSPKKRKDKEQSEEDIERRRQEAEERKIEEDERKKKEEDERKKKEEDERKKKEEEEEEAKRKQAKKREAMKREDERKKIEEEEKRKEQEEKKKEAEEKKKREEEKKKREEEKKKREEEKKKDEEEKKKREEEKKKREEEKKKREEEKKKEKEDNEKHEEEEDDSQQYTSCGNQMCSSQLKMALRAAAHSDTRYSTLLDAVRGIQKDLKDIKTALSSTKPGKPARTCKIQELKDVNVDPDHQDLNIPEGMVHVGGGRLIRLVDVVKVEKNNDDLRGRIKALCHLYWPGEELQFWSLSGKKGGKTVNRITSDYSAGMAEILCAMNWRKKANLRHENVHRTLCRAISEIDAHKKEKQKQVARKKLGEEKKKKRDSTEDKETDESSISDEETGEKEEEEEESDSEDKGGDEDEDQGGDDNEDQGGDEDENSD